MNLLHDIAPGTKKEMNVIIEIPKESHNKYEIDKKTGLIKLDRANYSSAAYPFDYGFVPQTLWDDGDALDVIVLTTYPLNVGVLVSARPVGLLKMIDGGDLDDKVIAVPVEDKRWDDVHDLKDLNQHTLKEFIHFFETYKNLKGKPAKVTINGYEGRAAAEAAFEKGRKLYTAAKPKV
ncbi:inorganic pyrophosphatase [Candidatus Kaiserbacteria bacterium CG10_big_fil_rev_8_21_14_0_10_56_12]|uniref:Inorganic pyrophosphatase n=1 Tax=Candidatus Kaiserbacteria bacterium CG10_big_fil_rev_8_21_14_0_10_56_12 TaxID=1974611 RepID=A0A2H0U8Z5_9BACT|nr:MAG: inorganic pyrophosphatase [Candidatus Kaiserbacteria bacterium CG10_big_fil_rev_8_21_14_0_10_56_12]